MRQIAMKVIGKCPIKMRCGLMKLDVPLGTSTNAMNAEISLKAGVAMMQTFLDVYDFRTSLINKVLLYELYDVESVRLISFDLLKRK